MFIDVYPLSMMEAFTPYLLTRMDEYIFLNEFVSDKQ